jgi:plastocyanin
MKKFYIFALSCLAFTFANAASFTVTIVGNTYSPATLTVSIGDVVTIQANSTHPLVEVDQTTWNNNQSTPKAGGFGPVTADYTFTVSTTNTIYYVCTAHVSMGMKGMITVSAAGIASHSNFLQELNLFPNPAQSEMKMKFNLTEPSLISIKLTSVSGSETVQLINNLKLSEGKHEYGFDLLTLPSGNYICEIRSGKEKITRPVLISR